MSYKKINELFLPVPGEAPQVHIIVYNFFHGFFAQREARVSSLQMIYSILIQFIINLLIPINVSDLFHINISLF